MCYVSLSEQQVLKAVETADSKISFINDNSTSSYAHLSFITVRNF